MNNDSLQVVTDEIAVPYQRRDDDMRDVVDLGIALQQRSNTMTAVEYLRSQQVSNDVIQRVLTEPGRRRSWRF
jgi:hypothetical protein